jgi:hypothetical protein
MSVLDYFIICAGLLYAALVDKSPWFIGMQLALLVFLSLSDLLRGRHFEKMEMEKLASEDRESERSARIRELNPHKWREE